MSRNTQNTPHPGAQFFHILTQLHEYVRLYQSIGLEGVVRAPVAHPEQQQQKHSLETLDAQVQVCQRCRLHTGRHHAVFGEGNPRATLMLIGEAPGEQEDRQGRPFVGPAGELLTKIIQAIGLQREDVYITNIVKCRPPGNRNPEADEIAACEPFLLQQLTHIQPKLICSLGRVASHALLNTSTKISALRGAFYDYHGMQLMPTFHPAYLLRNPQDKRLVWHDMQMIQRAYNALQESPNTGE